MSGLKEHKIPATPVDKKKARAKRIHQEAKSYLPLMLAATYPTLREELKVAVQTNNMEQARSIKQQGFEAMFHSCIELVLASERVWKQRKGEFMAD